MAAAMVLLVRYGTVSMVMEVVVEVDEEGRAHGGGYGSYVHGAYMWYALAIW